ncbi:hypothetical protein SAMN05421544_10458 [Riemerella columbipharyngis]|uniref:Uncharacterized protein n=1 Tax=Riemerella columbipharyngis TaxID=1071918 RepID=A0A1G7AQH7_9FLAO|nr:hypothetical protein SAMN05421544_10458 [Riemerella columbipharyngis]
MLKYVYQNEFPERFDVYIVEAPEDGSVPTVEQVKVGHKVYTNEMEDGTNPYKTNIHNIKDYTNKNFFIAIHHRTKKEDFGFALLIDDIEVGYDNTVSTTNKITEKSVYKVDMETELLRNSQKLLANNKGLQKSLSSKNSFSY